MKSVALVLIVCSVAAYPAQNRRVTRPQPTAAPAAEAERLNTLAAGYMGMQDFAKALVLFNRAYSVSPALFAARLNQGIALLNQQKYPPAKAILIEATEREPKNPRTWYNLGLLYKATGDLPAALAAFQKAIDADPADADSRYFAGQIQLDLKQYNQAVEQLERTIAIDPFHASAEYALARAYQRLGQTAKSREHAQRFQKLTRENVSAPLGIGYGQQGNYSLVEASLPQSRPAGSPIPVRFADATASAGLVLPTGRSDAMCFFDFDADGWM